MNITHKGTPVLTTPRLTLRRFTAADAPAMYRNWASDHEVTRYLRWPPHTDTAVSSAVLADWISQYRRQDFYQWAIVPQEIGEPIGTIGANFCDDTTATAHIGYAIGRPFWHRGYTSEALAAVIDFFFTDVGMNRIESQHDPDNVHSGAVMQKCGMRYEGTRRQADYNNRGIVDACGYAILYEDWLQNRQKTEHRT